jgi:glycosyltransferase involved in cell wall biosynthesis
VKIAIMMRAIDQESAFQSFMENLVESMLRVDGTNRYLLLYRTEKWFGRFANRENAVERLVKVPHKFLWDQFAVPYVCWREKVDVIFNPKFSVPLISHCPVAMGLQEMAWRIWPQFYEKRDVAYQKLFFPLYCRKAKHFFPWSEFVLGEMRRFVDLGRKEATITPPSPAACFRPMADDDALRDFQAKHALPDRFIACVTRVDHPGLDQSTSFFPGKNVDTAVRAFIQCRERIACDLVIAGRRVREYLVSLGFSEADMKGIHFLGFVSHDELPLLFNLAQAFVMPSFFEGYGLTMLEAMACGCTGVVSSRGACPEVSGGAALLADPYSPEDFAEKIVSLLEDQQRLDDLRARSLRRAAEFNWDETAKRTIAGLQKAAGAP